MEHPNGAIARKVYEGFNERDFERGLSVLADDAV